MALIGLLMMLTAAAAPMTRPAQRFVSCYEALGRSAEPLSAWERLTFSYLLSRSGDARTSERADSGVRPVRP